MVSYWLAIVLLALAWRSADSCMCSAKEAHPQTQYCKSDFVIVGRVQRLMTTKEGFNTYKVKIRNYFKATPKAELALKSGIFTPAIESMCGITLQPRETYVISGRIDFLKAHVNICNYVRKWREVTARQRKGFRLLYKQGCTCKVHMYWNSPSRRRTPNRNTCIAQMDSCHTKHGICLRKGYCKWTRAPALTRCIQSENLNTTKT